MIRFKSLKPGFSFLEVMIAIVLLAIFGTSLFQIQAYIFSNTSKSHHKTVALLELDKVVPDFALKCFNSLKEKKSISKLSLQKELQNTNATIAITTKPIDEKSSLFKDFSNAAKVINKTIIIDDKKEQAISFAFIPPTQKDSA